MQRLKREKDLEFKKRQDWIEIKNLVDIENSDEQLQFEKNLFGCFFEPSQKKRKKLFP